MLEKLETPPKIIIKRFIKMYLRIILKNVFSTFNT